MNKKIKIVSIILLILAISCNTVYAYDVAKNDKTNTIMNLPKDIVDTKLTELTKNLLVGSNEELSSSIKELRDLGVIVYDLADELVLSKESLVEELGIVQGSSMIDFQSHYCEADNSSTEDTVVIIDTKINCLTYNILVMAEYHINKDGSIYGYNIWAV